jgi:predicted regulator of Ras-like GTPase activity (Roadblock/LC7/MglB family)
MSTVAAPRRRRWWHRSTPRHAAPELLPPPPPPSAPLPQPPSAPLRPPEVDDVRRHQELQLALQQLERRVGDVTGAVVASRDGLALATTFTDGGGDRVAAMAASVVGLAEEILADGDGTSTTIVRGAAGCLVVHPAGTAGVVAARTGPHPNIGLLHVELPVTVDAVTRSIERC